MAGARAGDCSGAARVPVQLPRLGEPKDQLDGRADQRESSAKTSPRNVTPPRTRAVVALCAIHSGNLPPVASVAGHDFQHMLRRAIRPAQAPAMRFASRLSDTTGLVSISDRSLDTPDSADFSETVRGISSKDRQNSPPCHFRVTYAMYHPPSRHSIQQKEDQHRDF